MKPIIVLVVVAIAAGAMGTGFLSNTNGITLWIEQFGIGEGDIFAPTDHAAVDFVIDTVPNNDGTALKNIVSKCNVTPDDDIFGPDAQVICKLTDWEGLIIAEGETTILGGDKDTVAFPALQPVPVDIDVFAGGATFASVFDVKDVVVIISGGQSESLPDMHEPEP